MHGNKKARPGMGKLKALSAVLLLGAFSSMFTGCATLRQQSHGDDLTKRIKQAAVIVVGSRLGEVKHLETKIIKRNKKGNPQIWERLYDEYHFHVDEVLKGQIDDKKIIVRVWQPEGTVIYAVNFVPPEATRVALFLKPMRGFHRQLGKYCRRETDISDIRKNLIQHDY